MNCPKCGEKMEYEDIKFPAGIYYCDCGYEVDGEIDMGDLIDHAKDVMEDL